jgi:hypothetical protein
MGIILPFVADIDVDSETLGLARSFTDAITASVESSHAETPSPNLGEDSRVAHQR